MNTMRTDKQLDKQLDKIDKERDQDFLGDNMPSNFHRLDITIGLINQIDDLLGSLDNKGE